MNARHLFYKRIVSKLIENRNGSILVCGGGTLDKEVLQESGFQNVTISNLDTRMTGDEFAPFKWKYENAESLTFPAESFDYVVIHAAMHHCFLPHKVLTEMYRVARKGVLAFESRDSATMRLLERLGVACSYEHAAVYFNDCRYGGVNNTEIPNYVYRWTELEIEKCIQAYAPYFKHKYVFEYGSAFPATAELESKNALKRYLLRLVSPLYRGFVKIFPNQQNLFAFYIEKPVREPGAFFPWLRYDENKNVTFNRQWGEKKYKQQSGLSLAPPTHPSSCSTIR